MPKARKESARKRRLTDKLRKRNLREKQRQEFLGSTQDSERESVVSCETADGAECAPPGNFPGQGSIGLPPVEGKPLARVQASLSEKMHSPAPRLPSPRGSRLFVQKGKAPSPDSPPWVCAPPRAPGPDTVQVSGPAGQAQLDTSWKEETSGKLKDEGYLNDIKKETQSNTNGILNKKLDTVEDMSIESINGTDGKMMECKYSGEMKETVTQLRIDAEDNLKEKDYVEETDRSVNVEECEYSKNIKNMNEENCPQESTTCCMESSDDEVNLACKADTMYSISVQGSFHQADPMFGNTAGTQCVANCLAGLAYNVLKRAGVWQTTDMNKVLVTGDELYTYLQRCSSITNRYLLVEELPKFFECYNKTFEFQVKEPVHSIISLSEEEPCYEDFNAYPLFEALQMSLFESNGCFVCFGGNTLLIGRASNGFFSFDSHARCSRGYLSVRGKSTRIMLKDVQDVFQHLRLLALSMGFSKTVECELTGVSCSVKYFATAEVDELERSEDYLSEFVFMSDQSNVEGTRRYSEQLKDSKQNDFVQDQSDTSQTNDVIFIGEEIKGYNFRPLSTQTQKNLCKELGLPYPDHRCEDDTVFVKDISAPSSCKEIEGDGNCFFRAISFSLTNSESHHHHIRKVVCEHLLKHEAIFEQFLRCEGSLRSYLHNSKMSQMGIWATELEILAMSHMLNLDIYTYSDEKWLQYRGEGSNSELVEQREGIYLYHRQQNHYDVVLSVSARLFPEEFSTKYRCTKRQYNLRKNNRDRMKQKRISLKVKIDSKENRRAALRKKYKENEGYRKMMLEKKKIMYSDVEFKLKTQLRNKELYNALDSVQMASKRRSKLKYSSDLKHREEKKKKSVERYKMDAKHREQLKEESMKRYRTDFEHQENVKKASVEKYKTDLKHQKNVKEASINKYKTDLKHQESVKKASIDKYKTDLKHQESVKKASIDKYKTDLKHQESVKKASIDKYKTDLKHQESVKKASIDKYKTDMEHHTIVNQRVLKKYRDDESYRLNSKATFVHRYRTNKTFKTKVQDQAAKRYQNDSQVQAKVKKTSKVSYQSSVKVKDKKKERVAKKRGLKKLNLEQEEEVIRLFKKNSMECPDYVCTCCHRLLFKNQVQACEHEMYQKKNEARLISEICLIDKYLHECSESCPETCTKSSLWICYTCHRKIMSGKAPAESAANGLILEEIPPELTDLNSLERHLIAIHIPFMKVMALPHGGQKNVHGPVICVPSDMRKTVRLPMKEDENLLLRVKLKRKLNYKGYFEYQFVHTNHIMSAISYLKENNQWYKDIQIESNFEEIKEGHEETTEGVITGDDAENEEEMVAFDTCLQPVDVAQEVLDHYFDDVYNIAPGEGKNPIRMLQEPGNEAKAFPCLFPSGRFSWNEERSEKLTLSRYFNNRLMNADCRFAKDTSYIFFSQYMSELNQVIEKTQISLRKSLSKCTGGKPVTISMLQDPNTLSSLLRNDDALRFMQPIRGTPAYWASAQKDLFAMLRQLGIPTWFCSFSSAEYRWNDAVKAILKQQNDNRNPDEMEWSEKNEILRCNPVTVARMFDHRFQVFHKEVILSPAEPIGKVVDFFQRVEFQQRGSPHMHCLYWIENAPNIESDGVEVVCNFIDRYVTCAVPSESDDVELRKSVLEVQQHSKKHSKSCKKKGTECRFNFPRPPSQKTFITSAQKEEEEDECEKETRVNEMYAKEILLSVWEKVQNEVDGIMTTEELFDDLSLSQELYEEAHNILSTKKSVILKRCPNEVWTNQYNRCLLKSWDANMDIQFVLDPFSCIVYIVSYISKSEREMGMLLKQTKLEAEDGNFDARQTMKKIGSAYLHHREVSAQEAVYRVCNLKMKECSRKVVFVPVGDNPVRLSKPLSVLKKKAPKKVQIIDEEDDDENEVWMTNIVERYMNRPDKPMFHEMCLADFCSRFRVLAKSQVPKKENENVFELQNGKGYVQQRTRTQPAVVRYPRFNKEKMPEKYYQSLLQLFLPHWTDTQLKPPGFDLFEDFYNSGHVRIPGGRRNQSVKSIVDINHSHFAKNEDLIENAQEAYEMNGEPEDAWSRICPETEVLRREGIAERRKTELIQEETVDIIPEIENEPHHADVMYYVQQDAISKENMLPVLQNLNETQSEIFYMMRDWCLAKIAGGECEPIHIFVTGGAGTGKSHLIKAIHYESSRLLSRIMTEPERVSVLLSAFTGTAAFNIGGNTLHHLFSLTKYLPLPYEPLGEQTLSELRMKIGDVQILIIDEISMVYKRLLYYVHERLVQIKKCKHPFGGVCVIAVGDFYQLPPVKQRKDERLYKENMSYPIDYWIDLFKVIELKEIMRQKGDLSFAKILNSLRVRERNEPLTQQQSNCLENCIREGPEDVLHVFSTNEEVNTFNLSMLRRTCEDLLEIDAQDFKKDKTSGKLILRNKPLTRSKSDGLPSSLLLSLNARVMLTRNCNVEDGLVNGVMGHICQFLFVENEERVVKAVGVVFDNKEVGKKSGQKTSNGNMVLIERVQEEMKDKVTTVVRHQFPIRLSWACTAHKVQGMTRDKVVVNLDKAFAPGQGYVALSRVTSQDGLYIDTENPVRLLKNVFADPEVKTALNEMPKVTFNDISRHLFSNGKKIIMHNIQSLGSHFEDLQNDTRFMQVDIICLSETWLKSGENTEKYALRGFQFHHLPRKEAYEESIVLNQNLQMSRGGGVGMYIKDENDCCDIILLSQMNVEGMAVKLKKENILLLSVYRPSTIKITTFIQSLSKVFDFLKVNHQDSIILGDFNEDAKSSGPIQRFMREQNFKQMVSFGTTEGGTILDHVYVSTSIQIEVHRIPTYYSYHDALLLKLADN